MKTVRALGIFYLGLAIALTASSAFAEDDPFLADGDGSGSFANSISKKREAEDKEQNSGALAERLGEAGGSLFEGPIESLTTGSSAKKKKSDGPWKNFENVEGTPAESAYQNEMEMERKVRDAQRSPRRRNPFANSLDSLEDDIKGVRSRPRSKDDFDKEIGGMRSYRHRD